MPNQDPVVTVLYDVIITSPQAQVPVRVVFTPSSSRKLRCSTVELYDLTHTRKFKIKLFGYGGTSQLNIANGKKSVDGFNLSIGEVIAGNRNVAKLIVNNSGSRSMFVKTMCYADSKMTMSLSSQHVSLSPAEFVLAPHTTKVTVLIVLIVFVCICCVFSF